MEDTLGQRVFALRKQRGLTQGQLGQLCGVSQQAIDNLEKGEVERPKYIIELAIALSVAPQYILHGKVTQPPPIDAAFLARCMNAVLSVDRDYESNLTDDERVDLASQLYSQHYLADNKKLREAARHILTRFLAKTRK